MTTKHSEIAKAAAKVASSSTNWADLSNFLFNAEDGLLTRAFPLREEREAFLQTREYKAIRSLLLSAMRESGLANGAEPEKSGKFVVRLPKSLHSALENEAKSEGVSLNQLVVTKLAVQLSQVSAGPKAEMAAIAQAYLETRDGYSTDRVICDPELDQRFLNRCRELSVSGTDFDLNWKLMYARKNHFLSNMPKTRKYTPRNPDDFEFGSEIALIHLKNELSSRTGKPVSLDAILCDPQQAKQFDTVAERLVSGFTALEYRWVALYIRKAAGRNWRKALKRDLPKFDVLGSTLKVRATDIPTVPGLYLFRSGLKNYFISHTDNLRNRISRHFDTSDSRGLPDWLVDLKAGAIELSTVAMPRLQQTERKLFELKAVSSLQPAFNYACGDDIDEDTEE